MEKIFLTGHRKSGTTLLHALFDSHPEMNIYPIDICLLYAFLPCQIKMISKKNFRLRIEHVIKKSTEAIEGKKITHSNACFNCDNFLKYIWEKKNIDDFLTPGSILKTISEVWCSYFELNTQLPFVFKETSQSINALEIITECPDIKFIQILRDPRDNYAALKSGVPKYYCRIGENEMETLASLINRSRMDFIAARELVENKPEIYKVVRFEDLTENPEKQMAYLSSFCGVNFTDTMTRPTILSRDFNGNNHEGKKFLGISKEHVSTWNERISKFETGVIEFWMSDVMKYWGYSLSLPCDESFRSYSDFYKWYNCRYFYYDSFK